MKRLILLIFISSLIIGCKKETFSLNVSLRPSNCGAINPMRGEYKFGDTVMIFVTPNEFYGFAWAGDWNGNQNPLTMVMNGDRYLIANFFLLDTDGDGVTDNIDLCPDTPEIDDVDEHGCTIPTPLYLDDNGVTIKCLDWGITGEKYRFNHTDYTLVDEQTLRTMAKQDYIKHVCTSRVTDMSELFNRLNISSDISSFDVSNVINMEEMFSSASFRSFNISNWNVSNVTNMSYIFNFSNFNGDISIWDVSNVTNMSYMFSDTPFNGDISNWDVRNVTNMTSMFSDTPYNGDISKWDVSNVTYMKYMFYNTSFNGDISNWDVSKVYNISYMFANSKFNGNISGWDVSNVRIMEAMFWDNEYFNQDLSNWNVNKVYDYSFFDKNATAWVLPKPNFRH